MFKLLVTKPGAGGWQHCALASYLEGAHQGFIHAHHAACVIKLAAVVWSREQSHQLPLGKELVTIFYHLGASQADFYKHHFHLDIALGHWKGAVCVGGYLMGSADEVQVVAVEELTDDVGSKREGDAAVILSPALDILVWVRPQEIAQEA